MILSNRMNPFPSRWIHVAVLLCAVVVLPFGVARAQDYYAIGTRLKEAVAKGEITQKQALDMMAALKKSAAGNVEIAEAIEKGDLTEEEAEAKWDAVPEGEGE